MVLSTFLLRFIWEIRFSDFAYLVPTALLSHHSAFSTDIKSLTGYKNVGLSQNLILG